MSKEPVQMSFKNKQMFRGLVSVYLCCFEVLRYANNVIKQLIMIDSCGIQLLHEHGQFYNECD